MIQLPYHEIPSRIGHIQIFQFYRMKSFYAFQLYTCIYSKEIRKGRSAVDGWGGGGEFGLRKKIHRLSSQNS
jgi:hypothetical protein